jgi:hypothetical protein
MEVIAKARHDENEAERSGAVELAACDVSKELSAEFHSLTQSIEPKRREIY